MRNIKTIVIAYTACVIVMIIMALFIRPSIVSVVYSALFQLGYFVLFLAFDEVQSKTFNKQYVLVSVLLSYSIILIILSEINGLGLWELILDYHPSRDFWVISFPFLLTVLGLIIFQSRVSKKSNS